MVKNNWFFKSPMLKNNKNDMEQNQSGGHLAKLEEN
jgi:hypothetical protein